MPLILLTLPVLSTLCGGLLALRLRRHLPWLVALGAGLLLGAAFLDLLPEAIALGVAGGFSAGDVLGMTLGAFLVFLLVESAVEGRGMGRVGGGLLILHSLRDGMAIGAAYSASHVAGYAVATGIVAHDLADGMNTVILTTGGKPAKWGDYGFLAADALAPFLGGVLTFWWVVNSREAVVLLVLAAGFFLQMATSDLLPRVKERRGWMLGAVLVGAGVIWVGNRLVGGRF